MLAFAARELVGVFRHDDSPTKADGRVETWRLCAWVQCSAPLPASSRRAYCSDECKRTAARVRALREDDYGDVPF
jgi:hypothetical protein